MKDIDLIIRSKDIGTSNIKDVGNALTDLDNKTKKTNKTLTATFKGMLGSDVAFSVIQKGFSILATGLSDSIRLGSESIETHSKLGQIFSDVWTGASQSVKELTDNYGLSTLEAEKFLGATGDLLTGLGVGQKEALKLSTSIQKLSVDLASFQNLEGGARQASDALTRGLLGERESMKSLGIVIDEAMIKDRLLSEGKNKLTGLALKQAKAEVTLQLALEQSKNSIGDYARTQDSFANQSRRLESLMSDLKAEIGKVLIQTLLPALKKLSTWVKNNKDNIVIAFKDILDVFEKVGKGALFVGKGWKALFNAWKMWTEIDPFFGTEKRKKALVEENNAIDARTKLYVKLGIGMNDFSKKTINDALKRTAEIKKEDEINRKITQDLIDKAKALAKVKTAKDNLNNSTDNAVKKTLKWINIPYPKVEPIKTLEKAHKDLVDVGIIPAEKASKKLDKAFEDTNAKDRAIRKLKELKKRLEDLRKSFGKLADITSFLSGHISGTLSDALSGLSNIFSNIASGNTLGAVLSGLDVLVDLLGDTVDETKVATDVMESFGYVISDTSDILDAYLEQYGSQLETMQATTNLMSGFFDDLKEQNDAFQNGTFSEFVLNNLDLFQNKIKDAISGLNDYFKLGIDSQKGFDSALNITIGTFGKLISYGMSFSDAVLEMGDTFDYLEKSMKDLGFTSTDVFDSLLQYNDFVKINEDLLNGISGLNDAFKTLAEVGLVDSQSSYNDWANLAEESINKLINSGATNNEILLSMAPTLKTLKDLQEQYGFTIDENLQKWIDLGDEKGLLDEMDPMKQMVEILKDIAEALGVVYETANDATGAVSALGGSLSGVIGGGVPTSESNPTLSGFASGGSFMIPPGYNNDNYPVRFNATSGEKVVIQTKDQQGRSGVFNLNVYPVANSNGKIDTEAFIRDLEYNSRLRNRIKLAVI